MKQSLYNLTQHYLERIHKLNPELNAFITVTEQEALLTATQLDSEMKAGIPIVVKDNIDTANIRTTIGSQLFHQRTPLANADSQPPLTTIQ
jgi:aspartyl-tRNA(Asn)/glutamyl-tRNA(Gln) amidotransferase subunit A